MSLTVTDGNSEVHSVQLLVLRSLRLPPPSLGSALPLGFTGGEGRNWQRAAAVSGGANYTQTQKRRKHSLCLSRSLTLLTSSTAFWSVPIRSLLGPSSFFMYVSVKGESGLVTERSPVSVQSGVWPELTCGTADVSAAAGVRAANQRQAVGQEILKQLTLAEGAVPRVPPETHRPLQPRAKLGLGQMPKCFRTHAWSTNMSYRHYMIRNNSTKMLLKNPKSR